MLPLLRRGIRDEYFFVLWRLKGFARSPSGALAVHSLHVCYQIALEIAFEGAPFSCAGVHVRVMDAAVLCELVASVEGLLAHITVKGLALLADVRRLVLLQQEIEVELLRAVVAVPFGLVGVVDPVIVER